MARHLTKLLDNKILLVETTVEGTVKHSELIDKPQDLKKLMLQRRGKTDPLKTIFAYKIIDYKMYEE
tara:strand:- start:995 stop:1195 length:201 start_codon:yes stop_codon:yes gene_type:complete